SENQPSFARKRRIGSQIRGAPVLLNRGPDGRDSAGYPPLPLVLFLLHGLAVQREIETLAFHFAGHAEADDHVDDLTHDQRDPHVIDHTQADADGLIEHLARIALDQSGGAAVLTDREYAGKQRTGRSSERVYAEYVERIIVPKHALETGAAPITDNAGGDADA